MSGPSESFSPGTEWQSGPVDADTAETVEEFARWLNYLLHPEQHDGPRRYVCADCRYEFDANKKWPDHELNSYPHGPGSFTHTWTEWEFRSVIDGFDPSSAFHPLHETSGIWRDGPKEEGSVPAGSMEDCFYQLKDSHLCLGTKRDAANSPLYDDDQSFRDFCGHLDSLLTGIGAADPRHAAAQTYHENVKRYAKSHENQMFALAEALGRYRGAYLGARDMIVARMRKMVEIFKQKLDPPVADTSISWGDLLEVGVSVGITAIFSAIPVGGPVIARVGYGIITDAVKEVIVGLLKTDEAGKTYDATSPNGPTWENTWFELVDWFAGDARRISDELDISIDPNADVYNGLSFIMFSQFTGIRNETETDGVALPELPGYVPRK